MLKPRGYAGSVRTLREHVARMRPASPRGAFLRLEVLVGEQAQVDWAFVGNREVPGGRCGLWLFVMVLSWSRMLFAEFVWDLTAASLRRSLIRAHVFFGGSPRQWPFDNPRTVVLGRQVERLTLHRADQWHVVAPIVGFSAQVISAGHPRVCEQRKRQRPDAVSHTV